MPCCSFLLLCLHSCNGAQAVGSEVTDGDAQTGSTTGSLTTIATSAAATSTTAMATGESSPTATLGDSAGSTGWNPWCYDVEGSPNLGEKIFLIVDTSASMLEPVKLGPGPPVVPWEAMRAAVEESVTTCLGDDLMARAQFGLRLMPGPVGSDVCGSSDALDIEGWVSGDEVLSRLAEVTPEGGRSMRRALEDLPADADLIILLTHGAPGCGDDVDPELLDTQVAATVSARGASVVIGHVAIPPGLTPEKPDTEPDGVDALQELFEIGLQTERRCVYPLPLFPAQGACFTLIECLYGNRLHPCAWLVAPPMLDPDADVDDVLIWIGDEPIPRIEDCATEAGWRFDGLWFGEDWGIWFCPDELCRRRWDEGLSIQHTCNPDGPG